MDGTQIGVLEETDKIRLCRLLQAQYGGGLEFYIGLVILGNFTDKTRERELSNEQVGGFLVPTDLSEGDGPWAVPVGFFYTAA